MTRMIKGRIFREWFSFHPCNSMIWDNSSDFIDGIDVIKLDISFKLKTLNT